MPTPQGVDSVDNTIKYVGITKRDPFIRFDEHLNAFGTGKEFLNYNPIDGTGSLSRIDARILEQSLINQYGLQKNGGQLYNQINSISPKKWDQYGL